MALGTPTRIIRLIPEPSTVGSKRRDVTLHVESESADAINKIIFIMPKYGRRRSKKFKKQRKLTDIIQNPIILSSNYETHERIVCQSNSRFMWFAENWAPLGPASKVAMIEEFLNPGGAYWIVGMGSTNVDTASSAPIYNSNDAVYVKNLTKNFHLKNNEPVDCVVRVHKISFKKGSSNPILGQFAQGASDNVIPPETAVNKAQIGAVMAALASSIHIDQLDDQRLFNALNVNQSAPGAAITTDFTLMGNPVTATNTPVAIKINRTFNWTKSPSIRKRFNIETKKFTLGQGKSFMFKDVIRNKRMRNYDFVSDYDGSALIGIQVSPKDWEDGDYFYAIEITGTLGHAVDGAIGVDSTYAASNSYSGASVTTINRAGIMPCALDISVYTSFKLAMGKYNYDSTRPHYLKVSQGFGDAPETTRVQVDTAGQAWRPEGPAVIAADITTGGTTNTAVANQAVN